LTYACLELRKCIEALSYEILTGYLAEAPFKVIETWQPDKVMKELVRLIPVLIRFVSSMEREDGDGRPVGDWKNVRRGSAS